jgi:hypothetical protein
MARRSRPFIRVGAVATLVVGIAVAVPGRVAVAAGSTLFTQTFANNTVNSTYPVAVPKLPGNAAGNAACLSASGNSSTGPLPSCSSGDLAVNGTAVITYSVTVINPETGPATMTNTAISDEVGSNCPAALPPPSAPPPSRSWPARCRSPFPPAPAP